MAFSEQLRHRSEVIQPGCLDAMQITCALKNLQRLLYTPYDIFHPYLTNKIKVKLEGKDGFWG